MHIKRILLAATTALHLALGAPQPLKAHPPVIIERDALPAADPNPAAPPLAIPEEPLQPRAASPDPTIPQDPNENPSPNRPRNAEALPTPAAAAAIPLLARSNPLHANPVAAMLLAQALQAREIEPSQGQHTPARRGAPPQPTGANVEMRAAAPEPTPGFDLEALGRAKGVHDRDVQPATVPKDAPKAKRGPLPVASPVDGLRSWVERVLERYVLG